MCMWLTIEKTLAYYELCPFSVNYKSVKIRLHSKTSVFVSKLVKVDDNDKDSSLLHNLSISVHYESIMFYSTGPLVILCNNESFYF